MAKDTITRFRWLLSYQKECQWLEEMALNGWFFEKAKGGIFYRFRKGEPAHMLYEVDRFNLPKKPTLEEIRHKEMFMDMATELGWTEVTHDKSMTYYFSKEYEEGGINELYNEEETRNYRAKKFSSFLRQQANSLISLILLVTAVDVWIKLKMVLIEGLEALLDWYDWFVLIYVCCACVHALFLRKTAEHTERELSMTRAEWKASIDPAQHKVKRKLIFTMRGLSKMLKKEEEQGWILESVTPTRYFFQRKSGEKQIYTMDTKWLTEQRKKKQQTGKTAEDKDWRGLNNDWQLQSVKEAEENGWQYVCALENRMIIYRGNAGEAKRLNDEKYDYSLRSTSIIGAYGMYLLCCGLVGGIIGFCLGLCGVLK